MGSWEEGPLVSVGLHDRDQASRKTLSLIAFVEAQAFESFPTGIDSPDHDRYTSLH